MREGTHGLILSCSTSEIGRMDLLSQEGRLSEVEADFADEDMEFSFSCMNLKCLGGYLCQASRNFGR